MGVQTLNPQRSNGFKEGKDLGNAIWRSLRRGVAGVLEKVGIIERSPYALESIKLHEINDAEQYFVAWQAIFSDKIYALKTREERKGIPVAASDVIHLVWEEGILGYYSPVLVEMNDAARRCMGDGYYVRNDARLYTRIMYACRWHQNGYREGVHRARSFWRIIEFFIERFGDMIRLREILCISKGTHPGVAISDAILIQAQSTLRSLHADPHDFWFPNEEKPRMLKVGDIATIEVRFAGELKQITVTIADFEPDGRVFVQGNTFEDQYILRESGKMRIGVLPTEFSKHGPGYKIPDYELKPSEPKPDELAMLRERHAAEEAKRNAIEQAT